MNQRESTPAGADASSTRTLIVRARGVVGANRVPIEIQVFEPPVKGSDNIFEALLTIQGGSGVIAHDGVLRGMGQPRTIVLSSRAMDGATWADVFRGKWIGASQELDGVYLPIKAATEVAGLYRAIASVPKTMRGAETKSQQMRERIDVITREYGQLARLYAEVGATLFTVPRSLHGRRGTNPNGPGL